MAAPRPGLPSPRRRHGAQTPPGQASRCQLGCQPRPSPRLRPWVPTLSPAFPKRERPRGRILTASVAATHCKTPHSPICVLPPKRENILRRHSRICQANSNPYWQPHTLVFPSKQLRNQKVFCLRDAGEGTRQQLLLEASTGSLQAAWAPRGPRSSGPPHSSPRRGYTRHENHRSVKSTLSDSNNRVTKGNTPPLRYRRFLPRESASQRLRGAQALVVPWMVFPAFFLALPTGALHRGHC